MLRKLDFCNSFQYGIANSELRPLQLLLNAATRLVADVSHFSRERVTSICIGLHFFPIKTRIMYKLCDLVFKKLSTGEPKYISDLLHRREVIGTRSMRSSNDNRLGEPWLSHLMCVKKALNIRHLVNITHLQDVSENVKIFLNLPEILKLF